MPIELSQQGKAIPLAPTMQVLALITVRTIPISPELAKLLRLGHRSVPTESPPGVVTAPGASPVTRTREARVVIISDPFVVCRRGRPGEWSWRR